MQNGKEIEKDRRSVIRSRIVKDEKYHLWGFKNKLQQITHPTFRISDVNNSNEHNAINIKNGLILPTGQWYAPSRVINDAWYCMVLHGITLYCMVLHGIR